ncbi:hypothetical protein TNCV_2256501 [Trichonephila clavipes]|nr:hypothetical protein TNCV_2256501 [Trichonephila clavipes]
MDFTEINSRGKRGELWERIDRQNSRFRTAKTTVIKLVCMLLLLNWNPLRVLSTRTATAGSDVVQSGRPIFDDFFQHLWPYIGNNTANVVFQMVKRLWLFRIDQ